MKKFFVTKSDKKRIAYIKKAFMKVRPSNLYIICDKDREDIYSDFIDAVKLPLKDLNKADNWITFINTFDSNSMLVIDNILKFIYFGDGKKKYLKDVSQRINNIIVTDVVPFYTEPAEIYYPFWFLGKEILGYNNYNSFKANHLEERKDGEVFLSHSFEILKDKIKDYYVQDYDDFFSNVFFVEFEMSNTEKENYNKRKEEASANFTNPIKLYTGVSESINLIQSRYDIAKSVLYKMKDVVIVNNSTSFQTSHKKKLGDYPFLTYHDNPSYFEEYKNVLFLQLPVIKRYNIFYILCKNLNFIQLKLNGNKLENYFFDKIYNNELRKQFDRFFYNKNM